MFTDPIILQQIGRSLLCEFLQHFEGDLNAGNLSPPNPDLQDDVFFTSVATLLNASEALPSSVRDALIAIAEMAAPENQSRLQHAVFPATILLGLDPQSPPVRLAFHLWLWRPYQTDSRSRSEDARSESEVQKPASQTAHDTSDIAAPAAAPS